MQIRENKKEGIKKTLNRLQRDIWIIDEYARNDLEYLNVKEVIDIAELIFDIENNIDSLKKILVD